MDNLIYPCLWFDGNAGEAAAFYCSAFKKTKVTSTNQMAVIFEVEGQKFMCLNGGPEFTINPSISFFVVCETEDEVDKTWNVLIKDGSALMTLDSYPWSKKYGWVQDRFGVTWQLSFGKITDIGQKITPMLMFTGNHAGKAEEAIHFYTSVFERSDIKSISRYTKDDNDVEGTIVNSRFSLGKNVFMAMDSSLPHQFVFNEAISLVVDCINQNEIDYYWDKLTSGGEESQCGWLRDKFGVSWQIVPTVLANLMNDPSRAERVTNAFLQMKKFNIARLMNS